MFDPNNYNYPELENNYDSIYDVLMEGGTVWLRLTLDEDVLVEMVTYWYLTSHGLVLGTQSREYEFPNGSHNLELPPA